MRASEPDTEADAPQEEEVAPQERAQAPESPLPLGPPTAHPPARVAPVMVPRWIQLVMLPLLLLGGWAVARAAGPVLLLFIVAGLIALLLNPFVTFLRRLGFPRGIAVASVYLMLVLGLAGIGLLLADPVANQVSSFRDSVPGVVDDANDSLADFQSWLDRNGIDVQVSRPGQTAVESLGDRIAEGSGELASFTRDALLRIAEGSIAVILIIVLSVYMLIYGERMGAVVRRIVPPGDGSPEDDFPTRIQGAVFGYVRGQLLFSLIMGTSGRRTRSRSAPSTASRSSSPTSGPPSGPSPRS
jgi:predicted PurR-regulated permease PerM